MAKYKSKQRSPLTEKQRAIATLDDYPHCLRAGAGTGRTGVLSKKSCTYYEMIPM